MAKQPKVGGLLRFVGRDFIDFLMNQKKWWLTALLLTLAFFLALVFLNEPKSVRPIVYDPGF